MRYFGSKKLLLDSIYSCVKDISENGVFCDPFGGIGTVGGFMKEKGYSVISGDILYFAHCFQAAKLEQRPKDVFKKLNIDNKGTKKEDIEYHLNNLKPEYGWIVEEYSEKRKFFTHENALKIQSNYNCIQSWKNEGCISELEYKVLISSFIDSFDKVANTAGTYYAHLKHFYRKALKAYEFSLIEEVPGLRKCNAYLSEAQDLISKHPCDILYLDPPYNSRDYQRYYHLPETVSYGVTPIPEGKSGVYVKNTIHSAYNSKSRATDAFKQIIDVSDAKCIIFHYTDNGLISINDAMNILCKRGAITEYFVNCKGYRTDSMSKEFSHHIIKVTS